MAIPGGNNTAIKYRIVGNHSQVLFSIEQVLSSNSANFSVDVGCSYHSLSFRVMKYASAMSTEAQKREDWSREKNVFVKVEANSYETGSVTRCRSEIEARLKLRVNLVFLTQKLHTITLIM